MREMTLIGNMDEFLERALLNKTVLRIYDESGVADMIVIVGIINAPIMNKIYVQYVNVEDDYLDKVLDRYVSVGDVETLFSHGVDIFTDDQDEGIEATEDDDDDELFDYHNCNCDGACEDEKPKKDLQIEKAIKSTKNASKELNEAIDIAAESLFKAIFEPIFSKTANKEKKNP